MTFTLVSSFSPSGDQPTAIQSLVDGFSQGEKDQVLLGVTGSGKTFSMAHIINRLQRPTLILAPNKTLAAQLYGEMKEFFPGSAVEYFVSYYDYYQPEAYVPKKDLYIEKESSINEQIDRLRHSATRSLLERRDVVIVASVSCIYGIGDVETYSQMVIPLKKGDRKERDIFLKELVELQYHRNDIAVQRGTFRVRGDIVEVFPAHLEDQVWRLSFFDDELESITEVDALTGEKRSSLESITIYPNSHYVTPKPTMTQAIVKIKEDLQTRIKEFESTGKLLEAQRIRERVTFDLEMLITTGMCAGIENYSRYLSGRAPGEPPPTLFEYLPKDSLLMVDESHIALPQLQGMYRGDRARKINLSEYGFRLPACLDNRPLQFEEWNQLRPQTLFVSATPGPWELEKTQGVVVEQVIRPTGLLDPICEVRPTDGQVDDLIGECLQCASRNERVLVTTLTKKMSESLTQYLMEAGLKVRYLHSDIETLERIEIIQNLRAGVFDVLVGINLLREGLDIPECSRVMILDADKEGFLRSQTSLIQTIGRAARHVDGKAVLYADVMTSSMKRSLEETGRRRILQEKYNQEHGITPQSIKKNLRNILESVYEKDHTQIDSGSSNTPLTPQAFKKALKDLEKKMLQAAETLNFEEAALFRDQIKDLEKKQLSLM